MKESAPRTVTAITEMLARLGGLLLAVLCVAGVSMFLVPSTPIDDSDVFSATIRFTLVGRAAVALPLLVFAAVFARVAGLGTSSPLGGPLSAAAVRRMAVAAMGVLVVFWAVPSLAFAWAMWREAAAQPSVFGVESPPSLGLDVRDVLYPGLVRLVVGVLLLVGPWQFLARRPSVASV